MGGKWWLWYLLIFFFAAPAFSQDTIYLDKKGRWLDSRRMRFDIVLGLIWPKTILR